MTQTIDWPEDLIEDLAERRCIVFLGSGVSATAKNRDGQSPKAWRDFLSSAVSLVSSTDEKTFIEKLIEERDYLFALQCIYNNIGRNQYHTFLRKEFIEPRFEPSDVHRNIVEIDPKIVITTNFDKIYDKCCFDDGHTIIDHTSHDSLINNLRSNQRLIIKAHGTIDQIDKMIFTKKEYFEAKKRYPQFYEILSSLFITNTILFLGCGLNDPDVNLLLENVYITTNSFKSHYVVTLNNIHPNVEKDWEESYNVKALKYGPYYDDLPENIQNLKEQVLSYRELRGLP